MSRAGSRELGLTPTERADRDGIASWDLVLDGRRRFDLRVTVILDPALALICWAHYAPPISDMFRKSYRRLLRWNDEFPFAKFSVGRGRAPGPRGRDPDRGGRRRRARPRARPDPRHRRPAPRRVEGLAVDRRPDARPGRPDVGATPPSSIATRPPARAARSRDAEAIESRAAGAVAASAGLAAPRVSSPRPGCSPCRPRARRGPGRDARPDDRQRAHATTSSPTQHRVRVTLDMVLTNHLTRHEDQALLLRPRVPRRPARHVRASS